MLTFIRLKRSLQNYKFPASDVHKSKALVHPGDWNLYGGAYYVWAHSMELSSRHPSGT